jgi:hypothetical protein
MAETAEGPTPRKRAAAAPKTAAPRKTASRVKPAETVDATAFALEPDGQTKSYVKFKFPGSTGCVGTVYVPLGTKVVKVRLEK